MEEFLDQADTVTPVESKQARQVIPSDFRLSVVQLKDDDRNPGQANLGVLRRPPFHLSIVYAHCNALSDE